MAEIKKVNKNKPSSNAPVFTWGAKEFADYKKDTGWFAIMTLVTLALVSLFYWQKNWTAMGVVIAAGGALFAQSRIRPKKVSCEVHRSGVVVDGKVHPFETLKSFWIIYGEHPSVRLEQTSRFSAPINMPIADEDPEQIRLFISKFLPENEERGEDVTDTISRWLRF